MPRAHRDKGIDTIYHVYQRGNNKEYIFKSDESKAFFINQVVEYNIKFDFELLAYVIMDNHYHFIIKTNKDPLDSIMFNINNVFVKYINKELKRTGHIFDSRYKCKCVESEANLLCLLRYIHRNPLRARMVKNLDDYKWSSHYDYKNGMHNDINTSFILSILSNNKNRAILQYNHLMNAIGDDKNQLKDYELIRNSILKLWKIDDTTELIEMIKPEKKREAIDEVADRIFIDSTLKDLVVLGNKRRDLTPLKILFIKEALNLKYTLREISSFLNSSQSAISLLLSRH